MKNNKYFFLILKAKKKRFANYLLVGIDCVAIDFVIPFSLKYS